jgi:hypothetical protein
MAKLRLFFRDRQPLAPSRFPSGSPLLNSQPRPGRSIPRHTLGRHRRYRRPGAHDRIAFTLWSKSHPSRQTLPRYANHLLSRSISTLNDILPQPQVNQRALTSCYTHPRMSHFTLTSIRLTYCLLDWTPFNLSVTRK